MRDPGFKSCASAYYQIKDSESLQNIRVFGSLTRIFAAAVRKGITDGNSLCYIDQRPAGVPLAVFLTGDSLAETSAPIVTLTIAGRKRIGLHDIANPATLD